MKNPHETIRGLIPMSDLHLALALIALVVLAAVIQSYQLGVFGQVGAGVREAVGNGIRWIIRRAAEELREMQGAPDAKSAALYLSNKH